MAYLPAHVLDPASKCWDRIQNDAGANAAFLVALDSGRLYASNHPGKTCSAGSRAVTGIFFRHKWSIRWTGCYDRIVTVAQMRIDLSGEQKGRKRGAKRALFVSLMVAGKIA